MIGFPPWKPGDRWLSMAELYAPAMEIQDQAEADEYFADLMAYAIAQSPPGQPTEEIIRVQRSNLAYYAGYYNDATRKRVEALFRCEHPVFGSIERSGPVTPEQAYELGLKLGRKAK